MELHLGGRVIDEIGRLHIAPGQSCEFSPTGPKGFIPRRSKPIEFDGPNGSLRRSGLLFPQPSRTKWENNVFNPRSARRPSATCAALAVVDQRTYVSILARPEGRALQGVSFVD